MKLNIFSFLIFIFSPYVFSQKIIVADALTKHPIVNVSIYNKNKDRHLVTNFNGQVDISSFKNNETLFFKHLSYKDFKIIKKEIKQNRVFLQPKNNTLEEVFISASKKAVKRSRIAQETVIISADEIKKATPQTTADLLAVIPGIKVQKSQFGGGSPILRGMEANRILLVIDGVRMNNAIYRKGHLQNSITVSPNILKKTEVIFGPSSVIYGSDALGGVIHYITKNPELSDSLKLKPSFLSRYHTVNNAFSQQVGLEIQSKKIASFTSFSYNKYGNLKIGTNRKHGFKNWGLQYFYSDNSENHFNEFPIENPNPEILKNVGFSQLDLLQKLFIPLNENVNVHLNMQFSTSSEIPRFDKLTEYKNNQLKFAEWRYGPQKRFLLSSQLDLDINKKWIKDGIITLAFQDIEESRITRKFNSLKRTYRFENVQVYSINADFEVPITQKNKRILSYGGELSYNKVNSNAIGKVLEINSNQITGVSDTFNEQTRYPDGGSNYSSVAIYANYRQDISKRETLNTGIRLTNTYLKAKWENESFITLPSNKIKLFNSAITATIGYVFKPTNKWQINTVLASGFRSPNIDDVGKVREKRGKVTVPNIHLKPEYAYSSEISILKYLKTKQNHFGFSAYYTLLKDYITRDNFTLNGSQIILYDGEPAEIIANVNKGKAYIYGGTATYQNYITKKWFSKAQITYTKGMTYDTNEPLSSIPPLFGSAQIGFKKEKFDTSVSFVFNGKKPVSEYNLKEGIDNLEETPYIAETNSYYGTPAWQTLNYDFNYYINKNLQFGFKVSNIFDIHYKEFASGISAPGRNFSFSFSGSF
jgi:hemoglobin/transferrin/lactoferrin receptor protein